MPEDDGADLSYSKQDLQNDMLRGLITEPLLSHVRADPRAEYDIIIALNENFPDGTAAARELVLGELARFTHTHWADDGGPANYVFARLQGQQILDLAKFYRQWLRDQPDKTRVPIYRVWEDQQVQACIDKSISTIKADACQRTFNAVGQDITWAVMDSGIDSTHPHFQPDVIDKTLSKDFSGNDPLQDAFGHGTHVAGIIAGAWKSASGGPEPVVARELLVEEYDEHADDGTAQTEVRLDSLKCIGGIAPNAKMVSLRVLNDQGVGKTSAVMRAINEVQRINNFGRWMRIHGVNLSLGYDFNPRWFGCGQSPLCVEVDRLVRSGVAVVVAAGNSGFSAISLTSQNTKELGYRGQSITDPGNADLAITVGSTHRDQPHTYGVSFFSSRGPTGDGRLKPDLVAPGEHIVSCATGAIRQSLLSKLPAGSRVLYAEQSGTSMAAPHVSGAIAAFLSVRREFIGQPEKVKRLFVENAICLKRERNFQGSGLVDLLKVLQAV